MIAESLTPGAQSSYKRLNITIAESMARAETHAKASHERFNIFSTLLKEADEVRLHTRFIHCLLDPRGSHDCESLFLDLFFETLAALGVLDEAGNRVDFKCLLKGSSWRVHKEASRPPHGQIDLLLESSGCFGIAIENKIYAGEQPAQLSDYATYLRRSYGEDFHLIYLTLDGKQAGTAGGHGYMRISYERHVLYWLEACLRETYSIIPVNQIIIQYRSVVRRLTHQNLDKEFMKPVLDFIRENPDIVRNRVIFTQAIEAVRAEVLDNFAAGLMKEIMEFAGDVKLNPKGRGAFSVDGCLWVTPHKTSVLRALPFDIWLEIYQDQLLLGMKVPQTCNNLAPATQLLLGEMNRFMNEAAERDESRVPCTVNKAWLTGWDTPVNPLNDEVIADWLRLGFESEIKRVSEAVLSHLRLLERAYTAACERGFGIVPNPSDSKINLP